MTASDIYQFIGASAGILALAIEGYKALNERKRNLTIKVDRNSEGIPVTLHLENAGSGRMYIDKLYVFSVVEDEKLMDPPGEAYFQHWLKIEPVVFPLPIEPDTRLVFNDFIHSSSFQILGVRGAHWYQIRAIDSRGTVWNSPKYDSPSRFKNWPGDFQPFIH